MHTTLAHAHTNRYSAYSSEEAPYWLRFMKIIKSDVAVLFKWRTVQSVKQRKTSTLDGIIQMAMMLPIRYGERPALNRSDVKWFRIVECHLCPDAICQQQSNPTETHKTRRIFFLLFGIAIKIFCHRFDGYRSTEWEENNDSMASYRHRVVAMRWMKNESLEYHKCMLHCCDRADGMWLLPTQSLIRNQELRAAIALSLHERQLDGSTTIYGPVSYKS